MRLLISLLMAVLMTTSATSLALAEDDPVVAVVADHEIRLSYVHKQIGSVPLAQQIDVRGELDRFINSVVHEEVLFQHGLKLGRKDGEWREKLKATVVRMLLEDQVRDKAGISDQDVEKFYKDEIVTGNHDHIRLRHVAFSSSKQCDWAAAQVHSEDDLSALAKIYHNNPAFAERGGDLGYIMRQSQVLGFENEVFDLPLNKLHRLTRNQACHLIWITDRQSGKPPPFEEIKDRLRRRLEQRQQAALLQSVVNQAQNAVTVERRELP